MALRHGDVDDYNDDDKECFRSLAREGDIGKEDALLAAVRWKVMMMMMVMVMVMMVMMVMVASVMWMIVMIIVQHGEVLLSVKMRMA